MAKLISSQLTPRSATMQPTELTEAILQLVNRPTYRPVKPRAIAQKLGLPKAEGALVKKTIKKMVAARQLRYGASHLMRDLAGAGLL